MKIPKAMREMADTVRCNVGEKRRTLPRKRERDTSRKAIKFSREMADPSGERELQIYIAQFKKRMKCEKLQTIPQQREELKACFKDARNGGHGEVQCVREQHYAKLGEKRRTLPRKRERDISRKGGAGSHFSL